jgi:hypothetical protein
MVNFSISMESNVIRREGEGGRLNYHAPQIYPYLARYTYVRFRGTLMVQNQKVKLQISLSLKTSVIDPDPHQIER